MTVSACLQNEVSRQIEAPNRIWGEGNAYSSGGVPGKMWGENAIVLVLMPIGGPRGAPDADVLLVPMPIVWFLLVPMLTGGPGRAPDADFYWFRCPLGALGGF